MVECQSCGGRYEPIQADGTQYFHRCGPLSAAELAKAVDEGRAQLPKGETVADAIGRRVYERANLRDENIVSTREQHAGKIKAEGDGVVFEVAVEPGVVIVSPLTDGDVRA
jgi:hypothetical protein